MRRRTREIAIRMALGAKASDIRWMAFVHTLTPVAAGMGAGFVVVLGIAALLRGLLFGISPSDPGVFALSAIVLGIVSVTAGYLPSRRASHVNPIVAMRSE